MIHQTSQRVLVAGLVACLVCWSGQALADKPKSTGFTTSKKRPEPKSAEPEKAAPETGEKKSGQGCGQQGHDCGDKDKKPCGNCADKKTITLDKPDTTLAPTSAAKFSCAETEVTVPPLWMDQPIKATWTVKNEGTANLTLRLKGG